jgi:hypothetical protein
MRQRGSSCAYTDAVGLTREFSKRNGWTAKKVDSFISDCVTVIKEHSAFEQSNGQITKWGIRPCTITVVLGDYKKFQSERPDSLPIGDMLTSQCASYCFNWGRFIKASEYQFFFDRGEPFYGHAHDRWKNKGSRKDSPIRQELTHIGESDMRHVPALQIADAFAWALNKSIEENQIRYDWQYQIQLISRDRDILDYVKLSAPIPKSIEKINAWKMPKRKPLR